jgi:4-alpha-glucanotransferase
MPEPLFNWLTTRGAGVLLHPTSLPGSTGIGTLGGQARRFVDFLANHGLKYWQVCPLGPTGYGDSPYQCFSAFAGNPYLIDLDELVAAGTLRTEDLDPLRGLPAESVDYGAQWERRWIILRHAFRRFAETSADHEEQAFYQFQKSNETWLRPFALFMAIKNRFGGVSWQRWPPDYQHYHQFAKHGLDVDLLDEALAHAYYQFLFSRQWRALKQYANSRQVQIFGDIPIFVAMDSADVWTNPELFQMGEDLKPAGVAGVPPDYFAADGQLWGNPLYAWIEHEKQGYQWWLERLGASFELYDIIRIDHFRGFDEYCWIPPDATNARNYQWRSGPGLRFFKAVQKRFPKAKLVAEDLGVITDSVRKLMHKAGLPGMKVLHFAFEGAAEYLPHNTIPTSVLYPGTHDNDTTNGWFAKQPDRVKQFLQDYLRTGAENPAWDFIRAGFASSSRIFVVPMQDLLSLGSEARMNIPGTPSGNWRWRYTDEQLEELERTRGGELRHLAGLYER